jgi:hypothetical protein
MDQFDNPQPSRNSGSKAFKESRIHSLQGIPDPQPSRNSGSTAFKEFRILLEIRISNSGANTAFAQT